MIIIMDGMMEHHLIQFPNNYLYAVWKSKKLYKNYA